MIDSKGIARFRRDLLDWFERDKRDLPWRRTSNPYHIWVSEVMLQQTQVSTVIPYFHRFLERFPDVESLARAAQQDVLKSWERMGYYARARNLHRAATRVAEDMDGRVPASYEEFRSLPGVGDYIAAAVLSIAFDKPYAAVDGNVRRVLARVLAIETPVNAPAAGKVFAEVAQRLLDTSRPGEYNQAVMELGAVVCRPANPGCARCPVAQLCEAARTDRQSELPLRLARRKVPHYHIAVGVVRKDDRVLITRRREDGLLGGLWEFPGGKVKAGETAEEACRREIEEETNISVEVTSFLTHVDHAYSHFKIGVDVYECDYVAGDIRLSGPSDHRWVLVDELDDYPFPGANHKFLPIIKEQVR